MILKMSLLSSRTHLKAHQNPPEPARTHQNPPKPTNGRPTQRPGAVSGRLSALNALKHKMFSYSHLPAPETHGSMSYVFFIDQIPKSLTFERAETRTTDDKQSDAEFAQPPPARAERSSPALIPSTSPVSFSLFHMHTSCRAFPVRAQ